MVWELQDLLGVWSVINQELIVEGLVVVILLMVAATHHELVRHQIIVRRLHVLHLITDVG